MIYHKNTHLVINPIRLECEQIWHPCRFLFSLFEAWFLLLTGLSYFFDYKVSFVYHESSFKKLFNPKIPSNTLVMINLSVLFNPSLILVTINKMWSFYKVEINWHCFSIIWWCSILVLFEENDAFNVSIFIL